MKLPFPQHRRLILPLLGATMALLAPAAGHAQHQHSRVEAEHRAALALLTSEQNEAAYEAFRQLYERTREPRALWRMATAEAALRRWLDAEAHMALALGSTGDAWIREHRAALEQTLGEVRSRVGRLTIRCAHPGATITVADQVVSEFPVRVIAGDVTVRVAANGYVERTLTVPVPGNAAEPVVRVVELLPSGAPSSPPPVVVAAAPSATAPAITVALQPRREPARLGAARALSITGFALGGASVAVGIAGIVMRNDAATRFNDDLSCWSNGGVAQGSANCAEQLRAVDTWQAVSIAGLVTGGVLLSGAAILWVASALRADAQHPSRARVYPVSGPGLIGAGVGGVW